MNFTKICEYFLNDLFVCKCRQKNMKRSDSRPAGRSRRGIFSDSKSSFISSIIEKKDELPDAPQEKNIEVSELLHRENTKDYHMDTQNGQGYRPMEKIEEIKRAKFIPQEQKYIQNITQKPLEKKMSNLLKNSKNDKKAKMDKHKIIQKSEVKSHSIKRLTNIKNDEHEFEQIKKQDENIALNLIRNVTNIAKIIQNKNEQRNIIKNGTRYGFRSHERSISTNAPRLTIVNMQPIDRYRLHTNKNEKPRIIETYLKELLLQKKENSGYEKVYETKIHEKSNLEQTKIDTHIQQTHIPVYFPMQEIRKNNIGFLQIHKPRSTNETIEFEKYEPYTGIEDRDIIELAQKYTNRQQQRAMIGKPIMIEIEYCTKYRVDNGIFARRPANTVQVLSIETQDSLLGRHDTGIVRCENFPYLQHMQIVGKYEVKMGLFDSKPKEAPLLEKIHAQKNNLDLNKNKFAHDNVHEAISVNSNITHNKENNSQINYQPAFIAIEKIEKYEVRKGFFYQKPNYSPVLNKINITKTQPQMQFVKTNTTEGSFTYLQPRILNIEKIERYKVNTGILTIKPRIVEPKIAQIKKVNANNFTQESAKPRINLDLKQSENKNFADEVTNPVIKEQTVQKIIATRPVSLESKMFNRNTQPKKKQKSFLSLFEMDEQKNDQNTQIENKENLTLIDNPIRGWKNEGISKPNQSSVIEKINLLQSNKISDFVNLDTKQWDAQYQNELSYPVPSDEQIRDYYKNCSVTQRDYLHGLEIEKMYWEYAKAQKSTKESIDLEARFMNALENSTAEQRVVIEQCINLTKAVGAVNIFTSEQTQSTLAREAYLVYNDLVQRHPNINTLVNYQVARLGLYKAYSKKSIITPSQFYSFVSKLDNELKENVYAMRASFFDRIINEQKLDQSMHEMASREYSQILMQNPKIVRKLEMFLKIRRGLGLFFELEHATNVQDKKMIMDEWQRIVNENNDIRTVIFYELASLFYRPRERLIEKYGQEDIEK
jgi:hypothetical protein